jgi:hypothetical protein
MEECGYGAVLVKGKVIFWVDTGDNSCFIIWHFKGRNSSISGKKNTQLKYRQMYKIKLFFIRKEFRHVSAKHLVTSLDETCNSLLCI